MIKKPKTPKIIADPIYGVYDIRPVLPMIETEAFQSLGDKRQLGMTYLTFPSATHTRRAHSLGSYYATRELADRWIKFGFIGEREGDALAAYALYHDIGHPAFSHVTEDLCALKESSDPDERGMSVNGRLSLEIIRNSRAAIEACGVDFGLVEKLASHKSPLVGAVSDKNLGAEKLDYLERDAACTILSRPVGIDYLRKHIYFIENKIAIDEKVIDNAIEVQNFYIKMYKNVYLRKISAIAQRMVQKMTYHLILAGEITPHDLPKLTDSELLGIMRFTKDAVVKELYHLLKTRDLFREAIVMRPERFMHAGTKAGKPIEIIGVNDADMSRLMQSPSLEQKNQAGLEALENKIAGLAGMPNHSVLLVPIFSPHRFEASDISIYTESGALESLKGRYPTHFKSMEETGQSYLALRVCTPEKYRKILSEPRIARKAADLLLAAR